jgi:hypothetical protein
MIPNDLEFNTLLDRINPKYILEVVEQAYIPRVQQIYRPTYNPYPDYRDRICPCPTNFRFLDFTLFNGQRSISALEHISRFIHQCREVVDFEFLKLRLFLNLLMGSAFTWYIYHQTLFRIGMTYKLYFKHPFLGKLKQYIIDIVK